MSGKEPSRNPSSSRRAGAATALALTLLATSSPARAGGGFWDSALETLGVKATPSEPPPAFVERTRPDPAGLGYMPPAVPHKVSPLPVKTVSQIEAKKAALDAAQARQLNPAPPAPLQVAKGQKAAAAKAPAGVAD